MRLPQELVDAIIDCIGIPYALASSGKSCYLPERRRGKDCLRLLALVSRACNHRVRSHLFRYFKIRALYSLDQCPDALLGYARTLKIVQHYEHPSNALLILRRFISSPLVSITLYLQDFPEELLEMLRSSFPDIRRISVRSSSLTPSVLLNLVSTLERVHVVSLRRCRLNNPTEGDGLPTLPFLHGRLSISDPHFAITGLLGRIPLPLRSLRYVSRAFPPEKKIIDACAVSLENLEVKMLIDWAKKNFTLDLELCINLRHIIFYVLCDQDENTLTWPISELLLTLQEHMLLSIRLTAKSQPPSLRPDLGEQNPPEMRAWERLDRILYKLGAQAQGRGEILTFTLASDSLIAATRESFVKLLPQFNQIGICERVHDLTLLPHIPYSRC